eukprot:gene7818-51874_t
MYFEQITRMTADQEALHKQVVQLQSLNEKKDREYVENQIALNAEKENCEGRPRWKNKAALLQQELERRQK